MKRITFWILMTVVCCIFAVPIQGSASEGTQPFVVASDLYGSSNFAMSKGDGTLLPQQEIIRFDPSDDWSFSNGVGDFDNDGALDVILAVGYEAGIVYLFGKIENNGFVEQSRTTEWSKGRYPGRMAVADFDEDGNLDFIMTYDESIDCDFYKGHGDLTFTPYELQGAAPLASIGADSGDFNKDGHADFVAVSYSYGLAYINLGNGDGTFTTLQKTLITWSGFRSVAAGDLNGDGLDDLVVNLAAYSQYLAVFLNNGLVETDNSAYGYGFTLFTYVIDYNMDVSPVDTYDLNADNNQDLIIGRYNHDTPDGFFHGIGVMLGNGDGTFGPGQSYGGATEGLDLITSVSAPTLLPAEVRNMEPVAVLYIDQYEVAAGQPVILDGQDSYDEDGEIVNYEWDFGDDSRVLENTLADKSIEEVATAEHVYYEVGTYTITLTVIDDQGASGVAEVTVTVTAQPAGMKIFPKTLNLESRGRWVHAWVTLPEGFDAAKANAYSILIQTDNGSASLGPDDMAVITRKWLAKKNRFYIRMDRRAVISAVEAAGGPSNETKFELIGGAAYNNGPSATFAADDTIRTIKPVKKKKKQSWRGWKRRWSRRF
ncbi:MAG: VCBS repeat-containing protein [Deltaproteobacteria bacterium]|nr:VCBS repeat-containing protein [Deltaproteobacteria bacterium]